MKNYSLLMACVVAILLNQSCATLLTGTKDKLVFNTTPPNAEIYVDGSKVGMSGEDIYLKRRYKVFRDVEIKKEGYNNEQFQLEQKTNTVYFLNIFIGGIPCVVDIWTGAALKPKYDSFNKNLVPIKK